MTIVLLVVGSLTATAIRLFHSTTLQSTRLLNAERDADALERCLRQLRADVLTASQVQVFGEDRLRLVSADGEIEWHFGSDGTIERQIFLLSDSLSLFRAAGAWSVRRVPGGIELRQRDWTIAIPASMPSSREGRE